MRWALVLLLAGCASAPPPVARAPLRLPRVVPPREPAVRVVSLEEQRANAHDEAIQQGARILAQHHERLDGEARLHIVLTSGLCYRAWVGADGAFAARIEDEHGHGVAGGEAESALWLAPVCPRWSGSFDLVVEPRGRAFDLEVLLIGWDADEGSPSESARLSAP